VHLKVLTAHSLGIVRVYIFAVYVQRIYILMFVIFYDPEYLVSYKRRDSLSVGLMNEVN
jgi:hypothetical protein